MNISEILRKLADIADGEQSSSEPDSKIQNPAQMSQASAGVAVDNPHNSDAGEADEVMVPPLQLKLELLKRAVGVDNVYDEQRADQVTGEDPLAAIRRNAGIDSGGMTAVIHGVAGEDEPLDQ